MSTALQRRTRRAGALPGSDAEDSEILAYFERHFNERSRYRRREMIRMARNLWFYRGRQWFDVSPALAQSSNGGYTFPDIVRASGSSFPHPVDNRIAPGVDNETARLCRIEYEAKVRPSRHIADIEAAARTSTAVLNSDLEELRWPDTREAHAFDDVLFGTTVGRSGWDETTAEVMDVAGPDVVGCQSCGLKLASAVIPAGFAQQPAPWPARTQPLTASFFDGGPRPEMPGILPPTETAGPWLARLGADGSLSPHEPQGFAEGFQPYEPPSPGLLHIDKAEDGGFDKQQGSLLRLTHCPACETPSPLAPADVSPEEAATGKDPWERDLGQTVPKGRGTLETISNFQIYPQNGGIGVEPSTCKVWGRKWVEDVDWIDAHLPSVAGSIEPESPSELMLTHPLMGDRAMGGGAGVEDGQIYAHHAEVMELVIEPMEIPGLEMGRWIIVVQDRVALNEDLAVEVPGSDGKPRKVCRVLYRAAQRTRIPGEFFGRTPVDDAVPLQRRLNQLDAMDDDITNRGKPWYAVPAGTEIHFREDDQGSCHIVEVEAEQGFRLQDHLVNGTPLTGNAYTPRRERIIQSIRDILGPQQFELGQNPSGVNAAQQLQILAEERQAARGPHERRLQSMFEALWAHHAELTWAFRREGAEYQAKGAADQYERESYCGTDLLGETDVKVESQGAVDHSVFQAQGVKDAIAQGLYDITDPVARAKALELQNLPDINRDKTGQMKRADQAWSQFVRSQTVPVIDETLDDPWIWFQKLGESWRSDEAGHLQERAGWRDVLKVISGKWERELSKAEATDQAQRAIYEGVPPEQWGQVYQQGAALQKQQQDTAAAAAQAQAAMSGPVAAPPPMTPFPTPPQSGQFLPDATQDRIAFVLTALAKQAPVPDVGRDGLLEALQLRGRLIDMYAAIMAFKRIDEQKKAAAAGGAQVMSAPGGAATPAGMTPQEGLPVQQPAAGMAA